MASTRDASGQLGIHSAKGAIPLFGVLLALTLWAYWSTFVSLSDKWAHDPQYSHGYLVPLFSIGLLWFRRESIPAIQPGGSLGALLLLIVGQLLRVASAFFYVEWFDGFSLLPTLMGIVWLCFGFGMLKWSFSAIAFLGFMIPLPYAVEVAMRKPLRQLGTVVSTYLLQAFGMAAFAEGNVIVMNGSRIGVAEACSGLRMLVIFFALSTAVAMLSKRALWERLLIVLSAIPIALIANVTRITVTGILFEKVNSQVAEMVFHDLAGWLMMPFALALLGAELWLLARLFIEEHDLPLASLTGLGLATATAGKPVNPPDAHRRK